LGSYLIEETQGYVGLQIHHHADLSKSRSQYLPLLKMSVDEDPSDDRNAFYYGRELYFYGHYEDAANELKRHLSLPRAVWKPERAASMRYIAKSLPHEEKEWLLKAMEEAPGRREAIVDLAKSYYNDNDWENCYKYASMALEIKEKPLEYLCEEESWGYYPHDLMAISAYYLGKYQEAVDQGNIALSLNPEDERLISNMVYYKTALNS
jgi:tetratricopeptide (TPR) repeat protein